MFDLILFVVLGENFYFVWFSTPLSIETIFPPTGYVVVDLTWFFLWAL
jgi:hypothetical protein